MSPVRPLALVPALVLAAASVASAQQPAPAARDSATRDSAARRDSPARRDSVVRLPPIEVVGSILPTGGGPAIGSGIPARVSIVTGEEIDRWEPRLLANALARQAGVSLYDDLGSPYKLTLQSRGFTASPVVGLPQGLSVFLDGVPVNEPDAAQVNFDLLPLEHVRRVELLSGTSSLLGPNSLGGAVNLITRRGDGPARGEVELSGGSYGLYSAEASVAGGRRGWSYYAGSGYDADRGWRDVTGARLANGFVNVGKLGARAGLNLQLFGAGSHVRSAGSLPESVYGLRPRTNLSANDFEDLHQLHAALSGYRRLGPGQGSFNVYHRRHDAERFNVNQPGDPDVRSFSDNNTTGATADFRAGGRALGGAASVRVGASGTTNGVHVRIFADRSKFGAAGDSLTTDVNSPIARLGLYATGDLAYGPVTFSAGGRYDRVRIPFRNRLRPARDTTSTYTRLSPKGGVSLAVGRGGSLYASLGQSFRAPAVIELACADPREPCPLPFALGDDPPLAPVVATTAEVGGRWARGPVVLGASAYRTGVRNDIFLFPYEEDEGEPEGSTIDGYFANVSRTRREGVELDATAQLPGRVSVFANYAYTRATFRTGDLDIFSIRGEAADAEGEVNEVSVGDRLPLVPAHTVRAGVEVPLPRGFEAGAEVRHTGAQWLRGDEANETRPLAGYTVASLRLGYALRGWGVQAVVDNVLGARYATFGTFNLNQFNGGQLERFLTPGQPRVVRLVLRRGFGANGADD